MRRLTKTFIYLYLSFLTAFIGIVCLMSLQDSQQQYSADRCRYIQTELCTLAEVELNFRPVLKNQPNLGESRLNPMISRKATVSGLKPESERNFKDAQRVKKFSYSQDFPPLFQPVLSNGLNCTRLWLGESAELARAASFLNASVEPPRRPEGFYDVITRDCVLYRKEMGYIEKVSEEERGFPLAFSVLVYKDVEQVERLLRAVYRPHNIYCIHTDAKASPQVKNKIKALVRCLPSVFEAPREINVTWGTYTVLEPELVCMEALLRTHSTWGYVINLTGQEFPLKTNKELVAILKAYRGANDIYGSDVGQWAFRWSSAGPPPHHITPAKGPVHVAASRGFVDFVLHAPVARDFLQWAKKTAVPDETFFASMNNQHQLGIPGSYTGNVTSARRVMLNRLKVWRTSKWPCKGKIVRSICHFGPLDLSFIVKHKHMFVNKFTYDFLPLGYDCLEQWYFHKISRENTLGKPLVDTKYYENLEIVRFALRINATTKDAHRIV